jgi:hypothetical protein
MSLFKNLATDTSIEQDRDSLGGNNKLESGLYDTVIDLAYVDESKNGAIGITFNFAMQDGKQFRQTIYVTSGKEKGQLNYYETKEGVKKYLPGFSTANDICLLSVGEELADLETETKVLSIYDRTQRKEVPTKKEVLTDLLGKEITLGVLKVNQPKYDDPSQIITVNEISKVFRTSDKMTANEIRSEAETAEFHTAWAEKNTGKTVDKTSKKGNTNTPAAPTENAPKKSIFSK